VAAPATRYETTTASSYRPFTRLKDKNGSRFTSSMSSMDASRQEWARRQAKKLKKSVGSYTYRHNTSEVRPASGCAAASLCHKAVPELGPPRLRVAKPLHSRRADSSLRDLCVARSRAVNRLPPFGRKPIEPRHQYRTARACSVGNGAIEPIRNALSLFSVLI
jgi:hypothetical protein